jgi:hypothetical protein
MTQWLTDAEPLHMDTQELKSFCRVNQYRKSTTHDSSNHDYLVRFDNLQEYIQLARALAPMVADTKVGHTSSPLI